MRAAPDHFDSLDRAKGWLTQHLISIEGVEAIQTDARTELLVLLREAQAALDSGEVITFEGGLCKANNAEMVDDILVKLKEVLK